MNYFDVNYELIKIKWFSSPKIKQTKYILYEIESIIKIKSKIANMHFLQVYIISASRFFSLWSDFGKYWYTVSLVLLWTRLYDIDIYCCFCLVAKSYPTLCDPMDCSLPGSSVHGASQARILEWIAISFSRGSSCPGDWTWVFCIARQTL